MALDAKSKKVYLIGGVIGVGVVGWIYLHNKSAAAATTAANSAGIDPATGFAYGSAQDTAALAAQASSTEIDPATGYPYGSAQDESALSTEDGAVQDTGAAYNPVSVSPTAVQTNAAWAQAAQQSLSSIGYDPETIAGALGAYLGHIGLTPTQVNIVQVAIAEEGPPPVGSFSIIAATTAPSTGLASVRFPAPSGLTASGSGKGRITVTWNPVTGPNGQIPTSYTVAYGRTSGAQTWKVTASGTSTTLTTQPGMTEYVQVWANGGGIAPPGAGPIKATAGK